VSILHHDGLQIELGVEYAQFEVFQHIKVIQNLNFKVTSSHLLRLQSARIFVFNGPR
jgi:hypothetical protein